MKKINFFIPIQKVDEEKRLVYGTAISEEIDNINEIFDYDSSKPYIEAWSEEFREKTDGKSLGNLRAMHEPVSAGKVIELNFSDSEKKVKVCSKVIDDKEWEKVLQGVYTGFSFGGHALKRWKDEKTDAMRYTLMPNELSLADKPCVPSAVFEIVKVDGTIEQKKFKTTGGQNFMTKVQKNMDMTQFLELMKNVKAGLTEDAPESLTAAVDQLVNVLTECTGSEKADPEKSAEPENTEEKEKTVESGCDAQKVDLAAEIQKVFAPLAKSLEGIAGVGQAVEKVTKSIEDMQSRIAKMESQPQPPKVIKTVTKTDDGKTEKLDQVVDPVEEIKKAHNFETCAY